MPEEIQTEDNSTEDQTAAPTNDSIIIEGIKANKSKMAILTDLLRADISLDLGSAGTLYKKVGTDNSLLLNKEEKDTLVTEIGKAHLVDGEFDRAGAVSALVERGNMTTSAAVTRLKKFCDDSEIVFPVAVREVRDMEAVNAAVAEWAKQSCTREQIQSGLVEHFKYTIKNVSAAYVKIAKELGLMEGATGRAELAAWFATAENVVGTKKEIVARLIADTKVAAATADTRYSTYLFAVEYVKALAAPAVEEEQCA